MSTPSPMGQAIKSRLKESGMTQAELARAVGVTQAMISSLITGKVKRTTKTLEIADALGCEPRELNGSGSHPLS